MPITNYRVDGFVLGLAIKAPVNVGAFVNIDPLSGVGQTINGYVVAEFDRILLTAQTDPIDNGIYSVRTSAWIRDGDFDGNRDLVGGTLVPVWDNVSAELSVFSLDGAPDAKTIGVDALNFSLFFSGNDWLNTTITNIIFGSFQILDQVLTSASGVLTFDYQLGQSMFIDLTENVTSVVFANLPATGDLMEMEVEVLQDDTTPFTIAWPSSFEWVAGDEPDFSTLSGTTLVHMRSRDDGTKWLGTFAPEFS